MIPYSQFPNGIFSIEDGWIFLIDKPKHWTSFDVVKKIRNRMRIKKVGHAGTLDPLATGLVIVCAGKATKQIDQFMASEKEYTGTFFLGATTPSYDLETEPDASFPIDHITGEMIYQQAREMIGEQHQIPPIFSALKVNGKKMYDLARKGKEVEVTPRPITISQFEITRIALPEVDFRVTVSKGTYIRSLAFDFGKALNTGAYLAELRRTRSGEFVNENALTIEQWLEAWEKVNQNNSIIL